MTEVGVRSQVDVRKGVLSKVDMGEEGIKKCQIFADIFYGWPTPFLIGC